MQSRAERAVADLEDVAGNLPQALSDREAVQRPEREDFQQQEVLSALDEGRWFAHAHPTVTEAKVQAFPSVSKGSSGNGSARDVILYRRTENRKRVWRSREGTAQVSARDKKRRTTASRSEENCATAEEYSVKDLNR